MPLVGGITVREKPRRRPNEPSYKRLEFVRSKTRPEAADSWPLLHSSEPVRGIQLYQPSNPYQQAAWNAAYLRQHPLHYANQAQQYAAQHGLPWAHHGARGHPHQNIHRIPAPPLSNGFQPKQIEARPLHHPDDEIIAIVDEAKHGKKGKKGKDKKNKLPPGHAIFEDSSDSEDDYVLYKAKKKHNRHR